MKDFKPKTRQNKEKRATVFLGLCKGCSLCINKCPKGAISFSKKERGVYSNPVVEVDLDKCTLCKTCEVVCPDSAIRVDKKK
ncbi:MAG: 4Fe-4S binding protein [Patescibacteria group bacterium]|nr:4Fe-4S binding protein [Patescibacteria group bacterium]